jgi:primosomal protein N' (replication factor Y)
LVLRVALNVPLPKLFDYRPPATGADIQPGMRVQVPFGRKQLVGIVLQMAATSALPGERLRTVTEILDSAPLLDAGVLSLLTWAAEYYHHPIGAVIFGAIPGALRRGLPLIPRQQRWSATAAGREALAAGQLQRAPRRQRLLERLVKDGTDPATLDEELPRWRGLARALVKRGWIAREEIPVEEETGGAQQHAPALRAPPLSLREEQHTAVEAVAGSLGSFAAIVLHGVTGSGKTEVYLQLVERVLAQGGAAMVLVPEISLTPQLVARFQERFATPLAVLHSGLSDSERLAAWRAARCGMARVVLGTRSAVLAPVPGLALIIVDEEHDTSFKQHEGGFHYSARDVAVARARRADVPVVLGSATPSLETLHNVSTGRYRRLVLQHRTGDAQPPRLALVDLRTHEASDGLSTPAVLAIERHLKEDGQVLVFLNRRGYAPALLCTACGWMAPCSECDARMTVHLSAQRLRCHHCGADFGLPARCPACGCAVKPVGQGTERIEESLAARFPQVPLVRLDRDVVRKRGDVEEAVRRMQSGEARILVGTQMVTKGHDFPQLTLVVVLNADQGLFSCDFRGPERIAQTLIQVAGRAGRRSRPGEVLIQTELPTHPLLLSLLNQGYDGFARTALAERQESAWPPFSRLAAVRDSAPEAPAALAFLEEARALAAPPPGVRLLGPVPAAMHKRAGRYHCQLLIESVDRGRLHHFLKSWLPRLSQLKSARPVRWALDVVPIALF